jgi:phytoene dehydrogenase-like protein
MNFDYDAIVVGSGPNGLAAAITLAQEGCSVLLLEAKETIGGGMRTAELTLPGFHHDICSAVHPLGVGSPFFRDLPLEQSGLSWIHPDLPLAHPFDDGTAAVLARSLEETAAALGKDGQAYRRLMAPFVNDWMELMESFLGPLRPPRYPLTMARFGLKALPSAQWLAGQTFKSEKARGLFAGLAAHAMMPLDQVTTAAFGLMLGVLGHVVGWPLPQGGSQCLADALATYLRSLGGEIVTGHDVKSLVELPPSRVTLLDVAPRHLLTIAGNLLPRRYRKQLEDYRYGMGVFKVDWALDGPVPWTAEACRRAGIVHLGPTLEAIHDSERQVWNGQHPERPYTLIAQQSLFDPTRAPPGKHTLWAYCHVPSGSTEDMTGPIEAQIERFAPGFRDRILARSTMTTLEYEAYNPNYVGGDINCGVQDWRQLFTRPVPRANPYTTPLKHLFLCSSATPPGGGVHGMCGYHAARTALKRAP